MKSKPIKFGIRFYAVVGWQYHYLFSIWDNGSGNKIKTSQATKFTDVFRDLRSTYKEHIQTNLKATVDPQKASALWALQIAQMSKKHEYPNGKRIVFMDNFYTRHNLALQIKALTDNKTSVIDAVRLNLVDSANRKNLKTAKARIDKNKDIPRGYWLLVQCFTKSNDKKKANELANNTGDVIFNDNKTVIFYSNELADTQRELISGAENSHSIHCVHGLC